MYVFCICSLRDWWANAIGRYILVHIGEKKQIKIFLPVSPTTEGKDRLEEEMNELSLQSTVCPREPGDMGGVGRWSRVEEYQMQSLGEVKQHDAINW